MGNIEMPSCPRCGRNVKSFFLLGIDLTQRANFALIIMTTLAIIDFGLFVAHSDYFLRHWQKEVLAIIVAGAGRFALAYTGIWPLALHATHRQPCEWKEAIYLSVIIAATAFMSSLIAPKILRFLGLL
jgi:hypothetical protein